RLPQGRRTPRPYGAPGVAGGALPPGTGSRQGFIGVRDTCPHVLLPLRVGGARDRGVRVVEVEGRTLRTDPRQRREVVRRRWARGRPLRSEERRVGKECGSASVSALLIPTVEY